MTVNAMEKEEGLKLNPKFIKNLKGEQTGVILSMKDWDKVIEAIEDLEDAEAIIETYRNPELGATRPWEEVRRELDERHTTHV